MMNSHIISLPTLKNKIKMPLKMKILSTVAPKDYNKDVDGKLHQVHINVIGLFNSTSMLWTYYVVSTIDNNRLMTNDIKDFSNTYNSYTTLSVSSIRSDGMKFDKVEDADKYINEFKMRWEYATNDTLQEIRDQKLKTLTGEKS